MAHASFISTGYLEGMLQLMETSGANLLRDFQYNCMYIFVCIICSYWSVDYVCIVKFARAFNLNEYIKLKPWNLQCTSATLYLKHHYSSPPS